MKAFDVLFMESVNREGASLVILVAFLFLQSFLQRSIVAIRLRHRWNPFLVFVILVTFHTGRASNRVS